MSVPPEIMQMMQQRGAQPATASAAPPQGAPVAGPAASPMSTPEPNKGEKMQAMGRVHIGIKYLEQCLPAFGATSEEGRSLLKALNELGRAFGKSQDEAQDLEPSQIMQMFSQLPSVGGGSPSQRMAIQQAAQSAAPQPGQGIQ